MNCAKHGEVKIIGDKPNRCPLCTEQVVPVLPPRVLITNDAFKGMLGVVTGWFVAIFIVIGVGSWIYYGVQ